MARRLGTWLLLAAAVWGGTGVCDAGNKRPNILFLVTDDQRADTIGALGNPVIKTPHLDKLARRGFAFTNAYCMGSTMGAVCNPSRHMFLSGKSLFRYDPKQKADTFADILRKMGYLTFHVSKRGNSARVAHTAFEISGYLDDMKERNSGHHGRTAATRTIEFLKNTWKKDRPFFAYVGFAGPHDPRVAAKEWLDLYERDKIPLPENYLPHHSFDNGDLLIRDEKLAPWPRTEAVVRKHLHDYYGCISSIDHHIGRILAALAELGELDNTIIIFTSDHGLAIGSHGLFGKQNLYEHGMKPPLLMAGPGIPQGKSGALVYLFDILPMAVDLAGGKIPAGVEGKSLKPVLEGKEKGVRDAVFLAYKDVQRAVRQGDWKLIRYPQVNVTQLFDLSQDPHERKNLAEDPKQAAKVRQMTELLRRLQMEYGDRAPLEVAAPRPAAVDLLFFRNQPKEKKKKNKKG